MMLDSKIHSGLGDSFFVLVNGKKDNFDEIVSSEYGTLSIFFEEDTRDCSDWNLIYSCN